MLEVNYQGKGGLNEAFSLFGTEKKGREKSSKDDRT